jgi:hypothetical protein
VPVGLALEHVAHGEDRAAEVAEHHDPLALVSVAYGGSDSVVVGAETAAGRAAGSLDPHIGATHLGGQFGKAARKVRAVGYEYDADQFSSSRARSA